MKKSIKNNKGYFADFNSLLWVVGGLAVIGLLVLVGISSCVDKFL